MARRKDAQAINVAVTAIMREFDLRTSSGRRLTHEQVTDVVALAIDKYAHVQAILARREP